MESAVVLVVLMSWIYTTECAHQAVVNFNARGIAGNITFTELTNGSVRIQTYLRGLRATAKAHAGDGGHGDTDGGHGHGSSGYAWHVHTLPVDQTLDPAVQCLSNWVGPHYDPLNALSVANYSASCTHSTPAMCEAGDLAGKFGPLMAHVDLDVTDSTGQLTLSGPLSIVGRSVVVHSSVDGSNFECGTIQLVEQTDATVTLLQATFISPLAGSIYFKQVGQEEDTAIWGKLYWVNGTQRTYNHSWIISQNAPSESYRTGMCGDVGELNADGDLSAVLDFITVAATPGPFRDDSFFFTHTGLSLIGVRNRAISIGQPDMGAGTVACAPLIDVESITLNQPASGYLTVSQRGPYEETVVTTTTLPSAAIAMLDSAFNPIENCPATGSVFSPYAPIDLGGEATPDRYILGDWQSRYASQLKSNSTLRLFDMPVHGARTSISSLSVRYVTGSTRSCVALIPMLRGSNVVLAKATFTGTSLGNSDIDGAVYFVQQDLGNSQLGSTHVIVDVYYASQRESTSGHDWSVRESRNGECSGSGDFNPFTVSTGVGTSSNYTTDCSPDYPLRCQAGDLSGKHGQLELYSDVSNRPTYTFVDPNVQLRGLYSVINQSVVFRSNSGSIIGCARIQTAFVSSRVISVSTDRDRMLRTSIARTLADGTRANFSDILVLKQEIYSIGFGFQCLNFTVRVFGPTQQEADANADQVAVNTAKFECNHALTSVGSLSVLMWTLCFVMLSLSQLLS